MLCLIIYYDVILQTENCHSQYYDVVILQTENWNPIDAAFVWLPFQGYALLCVGFPSSDVEAETQDEDEVSTLAKPPCEIA